MADRCHLDIETYSEADLKKVGVYAYAEHPTTEVLVLCYALDSEPVQTWWPHEDPFVPDDLREHVESGGLVCAHNAQFERVVLNGVAGEKLGFPKLNIAQMRCTAAKAAAYGLPRALEDAAAALGTYPKKTDGVASMRQLSRPRTGKEKRYTPENSPEKFRQLGEYCVDDVEAERGIDKTIPDLSSTEQRVYELDQLINQRGVRVDLAAVADAQALIAEYKAEMEVLCRSLTGFNPTQRDKIAEWVRSHGFPQLTDLQAETVRQAVHDLDCPDAVARVLRLYSTYNAKAASKYEAIERMVCADGRLHGMFLYHGAGTGRWASLGVQLQNLFRPVIGDPSVAIDCFAQRDLDWLRDLYPDVDPMKVIGSCIRGMLVGSPELQALDYSGIESRVNAWVFDEEWKLDAFRAYDEGTGPDLYCVTYGRAFRVDPRTIGKKDPRRQLGKVQDLAFGYEGGVSALITWAELYGIDLDEMAAAVRQVLAPDVVESAVWMLENRGDHGLARDTFIACDGVKQLWRRGHPGITKGWQLLKEAAALAIANPGGIYGLPNKKIQFRVKDRWLQMRLPSGRCLNYFKPEVKGEGRNAEISYTGVDTETRRWMRTKTYGGKLCENAVQAISRDLLVHGLFNLEAEGVKTIGTVHDEVISEVGGVRHSLEECSKIMCQLPGWAAGLPVAAEGFRAHRYKK